MQKRQIQSEKQKHKNFILQRACVELLSTREVWRARKRRKKGFLLSRIFPCVHTYNRRNVWKATRKLES